MKSHFGSRALFSLALAAAFILLSLNQPACAEPGMCPPPSWVRSTLVPRTGHAVAFDSIRNRLVLFGGRTQPDALPSGGELLGDTWEFDGSAWHKMADFTGDFGSPASADVGPNPRADHAMAFDPVRGRTVMWGASYNDVGTVWEWDGTHWTPVTPASGVSPGFHTGHAMTFDFVQHKVVMVGTDGDHWTWDGANWLWRSNLPNPCCYDAAGIGVVGDPTRGRLVATGGRLGPNTYEWDGIRWNLRSVQSPGGVVSMTYGAAGRALLRTSVDTRVWAWNGAVWVALSNIPAVGGYGESPPPTPRPVGAFASSYSFLITVDGGGARQCDTFRAYTNYNSPNTGSTSWQVLTSPGPGPRFDHAMTQLNAAGDQLLFGGLVLLPDGTLGYNGETWTLHDGFWTQVPTYAALYANLIARYDHAMCYDSLRQRVILQGGTSDYGYYGFVDNQTYSFSSQQGWNLLGGTVARTGHAIVYDAHRDRVVLFGGWDPTTGYENDTWEMIPNGQWTQVHPGGANAPPGREQFGMAYDPIRQRTVLFGGFNTDGTLNDTWEWDGTNWQQVTPAFAAGNPFPPPGTQPEARAYHALTFDTVRNRVVLYGGEDTFFSFGDQWEWDGLAWLRHGALFNTGFYPGVRSSHALSYDTTRGRLMLSGGIAPALFDPSGGSLFIFDDVLESTSKPITPPADLGPQTVTIDQFGAASLSAYDPTSGYFPFQARWLKDGQPLVDQFNEDGSSITCTSCTQLYLSNGSPSFAGVYQLVSADSCGSYLSSPITVVVNAYAAPVFTQNPQPTNLQRHPGESAQFTAAATGVPTPAFQWLRNGAPIFDDGRISGSSTGTLTINPVSPADFGIYQLFASNIAGTATSEIATLVVSSALCTLDYNTDGSLNPDDLGDFITDYYTFPAIPGPGGYAVMCPEVPMPFCQGYKAAFTVDGSGQCFEPNSDNLGDFITGYFDLSNGCSQPD